MHASYGRMLKKEHYQRLMSCTDVSDAAMYLKRSTHYADALEGMEPATVHRGFLEELLRREYYRNYFEMGRFEKVADDEFFNFLTVKTEIDEILMCILHINSATDDIISTMPIYMNRYTCFDLNELAKITDFDSLSELLKDTPYRKLLLPFRPKAGAQVDYRGAELALRTYYFKRILSAAETFGENELSDHICAQIDIINIINAYRLKKNFSRSKEQIISAMIPIYNKLPRYKMEALYGARDEEEFVSILEKTSYGREAKQNGIDLSFPEQAMQHVRYLRVKRSFAMSQSPPLSFFTYNSLCETELKNVIRIIEGIRYKLPVTDIDQLVIV